MDPSRGLRRLSLSAAFLWGAAAGPCLTALAAERALAAASDSLAVTIVPSDSWPPAPVTDLVGMPGAEGQLLLQWTAPDSNSNALGVLSPAAGYEIRVASFSVDSVGGGTTAWWNAATDVRFLPAPAASAVPPAPGAPGAQDALLLTRLEPGATMYAAVRSRDPAGLVSDADAKAATPGAQAFALIYDAAPPAPSGLTVAQTGVSTFTVTWSSVTAYDLDFYRISLDSTSPYDFADAWSVVAASASSPSAVIGGLAPGSYSVRVAAADKGAPAHLGAALESPPSAAATADIQVASRPPQAPYGVDLSTAAGSVTVRWLPVVRYADRAPFADAGAPQPPELSGYRVYRASSVTLGSWTEIAALSTATWSWTGVGAATAPYYAVRAQNSQGASPLSLIRSAATFDGFIVALDDRSWLRVPAAELGPLLGTAGVYMIAASSRPQDLGGRVHQSLDFTPYRDGETPDPGFSLSGMGGLHLSYAPSGGSLASSALGPQNAGVYWWNGAKWLQMYGKPDAAAQSLFLETKYFGRYQIRSVERAGTFAFDAAGLSNRFVTPNGDGKNDAVVFTFDNPRDASVRGRILDLRGRAVVSEMLPGPARNTLEWRPGAGVPGGIYLYQLEGEGRSFTGTIVILK